MRLLVALVLLQLAALAYAIPNCRFAWNYTQAQLASSSSARSAYLLSVAYWEGQFHQPYVSYNPKNGYTYELPSSLYLICSVTTAPL